MTAARANRPLMKIAPKFLSGPRPDYPDSVKLQGAHGKVSIAGILSVDGTLAETRVAISSRSPELDAAALAAAQASRFEPAKDASGSTIAVPITMPFEIDPARSPGPGGGVLRYKCGQFVRDQQWWIATWGDKEDDDFHNLEPFVIIPQHIRRA